MEKIHTSSEQETLALGRKIAARLASGGMVALYGNLGAGKTTLIKGMAQGLGIKKPITSPTFLLMKSYDIPSKTLKFIHIDAYRIRSPQEILDIGFQEFLASPSIIVIEWADKIKNILPGKRMDIAITAAGENKRNFEIKKRP